MASRKSRMVLAEIWPWKCTTLPETTPTTAGTRLTPQWWTIRGWKFAWTLPRPTPRGSMSYQQQHKVWITTLKDMYFPMHRVWYIFHCLYTKWYCSTNPNHLWSQCVWISDFLLSLSPRPKTNPSADHFQYCYWDYLLDNLIGSAKCLAEFEVCRLHVYLHVPDCVPARYTGSDKHTRWMRSGD